MVLSDQQVELVNRLQKGQFGDVNFDEYQVRSSCDSCVPSCLSVGPGPSPLTLACLQPQVEMFSSEVMIHPVTNRPEHKRSFIPSLLEKEKVSKLVHAIKMGWIQPRKVQDTSSSTQLYYDLWAGDQSSILARHKMHLPAPKMPLPGHHESYNPPPEYLFSEQEVPVCLSQYLSAYLTVCLSKHLSIWLSLSQPPIRVTLLHSRLCLSDHLYH